MTIREIIEVAKGDGTEEDWPQQAIFSVVGAMRSLEQGEASTYEGDCAGVMGWVEEYGIPTEESVNRFIRECPGIMRLEIPDRVMISWAEAGHSELKGQHE